MEQMIKGDQPEVQLGDAFRFLSPPHPSPLEDITVINIFQSKLRIKSNSVDWKIQAQKT